MKLSYELLKDKILGCYNGKNSCGVLGAPFECKRGTFPVDYYTQKGIDNNPPPNDDLDLQLLWLNAVEEYGNKITPDILADYWLTYIVPVWSEYGIGKSNLIRGINPPFSGKINNYYGQSNGAFIRSEIWACLAPGNPEMAAHFAYLDACVDHYGEGIDAEIFFAATESAAFVESDTDKLVDIGLSYVAKDSRIKDVILFAKDCYKKGMPFEDARVALMTKYPGTFGVVFETLEYIDELKKQGDYPIPSTGDDVVNTVGLTILAWYYGEGDFEKTIKLATYCGEDADCTAATIGALLGIVLGNKNLPEKWIKPIGNIINTVCISTTITKENAIPKTTDELTDRILNAIPKFIDKTAYTLVPFEVTAKEGKDLYNLPYPRYLKWGSRDCGTYNFSVNELNALKENSIFYTFDNFKAVITLDKAPYIANGESINLTVKISDNGMLRKQHYVNVTAYTGAGLKVDGAKSKTVAIHNSYEYDGVTTFTITAEELIKETNTVLIEMSMNGRHTYEVAKINLISK